MPLVSLTMRTHRGLKSAIVAATVLIARSAAATPSTTFWAPSTPFMQPPSVLHVTYDSYFGRDTAYPIDVGLELGVPLSKQVQAELGFDLVYPTLSAGQPLAVPVLINGKIGAAEGAYFAGSPAWSAGAFGIGFKKDATDYNVLSAVVGKTIPRLGALAVGGYYGLNPTLLRSSSGEDQRAGILAGWQSPAARVPLLDHVNLAWDVQTGRNVLGATGGGVYLYLTPSVDLLTGPVFFFDEALQPGGVSWMWSVQLDADIDFASKKASGE